MIFVSGGEPLEGCEPLTLLVTAATSEEAERRARELGVWDPLAWDDISAKAQHVDLALADSRGFAWKPGDARRWQSSYSWPGRGSTT